MRFRVAVIGCGALILLACSLPLGPAAAPTAQVPPTPSQGGQPVSINTSLPNLRVGASGGSCGPLAADASGQKITGTLIFFPNAGPNQLRAVMSDGHYVGNVAMLNGNCQPSGQTYSLSAVFGIDYTTTICTAGADRCISSSNLVITSLNLQGLPGPLNAIVEPLIMSELPPRMAPRIDELVARRLNNGRLPAGGAHCPGGQ
ncbi:MAG: hypothetical protein ACM3JD_09185 [Rudaea sp.]